MKKTKKNKKAKKKTSKKEKMWTINMKKIKNDKGIYALAKELDNLRHLCKEVPAGLSPILIKTELTSKEMKDDNALRNKFMIGVAYGILAASGKHTLRGEETKMKAWINEADNLPIVSVIISLYWEGYVAITEKNGEYLFRLTTKGTDYAKKIIKQDIRKKTKPKKKKRKARVKKK